MMADMDDATRALLNAIWWAEAPDGDPLVVELLDPIGRFDGWSPDKLRVWLREYVVVAQLAALRDAGYVLTRPENPSAESAVDPPPRQG